MSSSLPFHSLPHRHLPSWVLSPEPLTLLYYITGTQLGAPPHWHRHTNTQSRSNENSNRSIYSSRTHKSVGPSMYSPIQTVSKVYTTDPAVGVDGHAKRFDKPRAVCLPYQIGQVDLNLIPTLWHTGQHQQIGNTPSKTLLNWNADPLRDFTG